LGGVVFLGSDLFAAFRREALEISSGRKIYFGEVRKLGEENAEVNGVSSYP
jgi:hypothetical protein